MDERPTGVEPDLLEVRSLSVDYRIGSERVPAVSDVSLTLGPGSSLGVVGESGSGKSTLAMALVSVLPPNGLVSNGSVVLDGTDILRLPAERLRREVRWKKISIVFQSAMNCLSPVTKIRDQLVGARRLHRPDEPAADSLARVIDLLRLVGLSESVLDMYPHELSGGMRQRAVIAVSLVADPRIVIADEATTALDVVVQSQILTEIARMREALGIGLLVISHDVEVIRRLCDEVMVMYAGEVVESGPTDEVFQHPRHPYTGALLSAVPSLDGPRRRLVPLAGSAPHGSALPKGCRFASRCAFTQERCRIEPPALRVVNGRDVRCHFADDPVVREALEKVGG